MKNQHTPGPWKIDNQFWEYIHDSSNRNVALCLSKTNLEGDARLIAASPDLLAAAKELLSLNYNPNSYERLKAAVAKATGGEV